MIENKIKKESKVVPEILTSQVGAWSTKIGTVCDKVIESLLDFYCTEFWKDKETTKSELREFESSIRNQVFPEFIDAKVEKKIHLR